MRLFNGFLLFLFAVTLFTSATLLFLVQPMVGKMLLPFLGGTPAVWNTCMVFFQAMLLAGYAYAHVTSSLLGVRWQAILHLGVLLLPALVLPITINRDLVPQGENSPVFGTLALLFVSAGLPFFVVATSAPLLQKWFSRTGHSAAQDPYFLYGASNLGSMLALLSYPTLVEPYLVLRNQTLLWAISYGLLAALTAGCAVLLWLSPRHVTAGKRAAAGAHDLDEGLYTRAPTRSSPLAQAQPNALTRLRWVALAFVPSSLMLGVTTYITTDIAAIPLLWIVPLSIYLLSFILVFSRIPAFIHMGMVLLLPLVILAAIFITHSGMIKLWVKDETLTHLVKILAHLVTLFVVAMVCHGELARTRPSTEHLTEFYLWMSLGGVLGGLCNALVAPLVFNAILEYPLALVLACLLMPRLSPRQRTWLGWTFDLGLALGIGILAVWLIAPELRGLSLPDVPVFVRDKSRELIEIMRQHGVLPIILLSFLGVVAYCWLGKTDRWGRALDVLLPLLLGLLVVGLLWGLPRDLNFGRLSAWFNLSGDQWQALLQYGLPAMLCLAFVPRPVALGLGVGTMLLVIGLKDASESDTLHQERSFFGVMSVRESEQGRYHQLLHGTTTHGLQRLTPDPKVAVPLLAPLAACPAPEDGLCAATGYLMWLEHQRKPIAYFHPDTPIGQLFEAFSGSKAKRNIAIFGLGTGGLSGYAQHGQKVTYFEIDGAIKRIASDPRYFTYLRDAKARGVELEIVMGDARLQLEKKQVPKPEDKYDLIIMDAFSSDAVPVHLITKEAIQMYFSKLADDGIVVVHISNRYLDLQPVLGKLKEETGLAGLVQSVESDHSVDRYGTTWVILARRKEDFGELATDERWHETELQSKSAIGLWTDDYSNLLRVFWETFRDKRRQ